MEQCLEGTEVAQTSSLLYRGLPVRTPDEHPGVLAIGRPACWKQAIQQVGNLRHANDTATTQLRIRKGNPEGSDLNSNTMHDREMEGGGAWLDE